MVNFEPMCNFRGVAIFAVGMLALAGCQQSSNSATTTAPPKAADKTPHLAAMKIEDVKKGDGGEFGEKTPIKAGDKVFVTYTGKLEDGTVFDSNDAPDKDPFIFVLGNGSVIKGWDKGMLGMVVGGERKLSVPYNLAYGAGKPGGPIPAYSDLYFDIKLLDVIPAAGDTDVTFDDIQKGKGPQVATGRKATINYKITDLKGGDVDTNSATWKFGDGSIFQSIELGIKGMRQGGVRVLRLGPDAAIVSPALKAKGASPQTIQHVKITLVKVG
jgi:FKBP-type peptidyl-prolyl cis-trans isomerase